MTGEGGGVGLRDAQRLLVALTAGQGAVADGGATLETMTAAQEPPRLVSATVIEGTTLRARRVHGEPTAAFGAFLDGTQQSRVAHYVDGLPVVHGTVAAVIRARINRRMVTWGRGPLVRGRLYIPRRFLPDAWEYAVAHGCDPLDTTAAGEAGAGVHPHPFELLQRAVHLVQRDREALEQQLAEEWCTREQSPLYIDGGISKSERVATAPCAVGVVKSHRTLYVDERALRTVLELPAVHRSSVFRVTFSSDWLHPVASWYLRVRDPRGHDPMWGLVRVEVAVPDPAASPAAVAERADAVSRWILAEATPLSLPDARWDKMAYGIRDCEEFLRAIC